MGFANLWAQPKPPARAWLGLGLAQAVAFGREIYLYLKCTEQMVKINHTGGSRCIVSRVPAATSVSRRYGDGDDVAT